MQNEPRFDVIYEQGKGLNEQTRVLRDRETGVCYLFYWMSTGAGLTVLVDKDGKPIVMEENRQS
ncbi:DUF6440 family protein [Deinococcus antarcticus]|uniref:DUF6440 family protein n=1 Tax=Deinococcus antarcticus TaxID=1298767 RepID=A0ABV8A1R8_9DEIO